MARSPTDGSTLNQAFATAGSHTVTARVTDDGSRPDRHFRTGHSSRSPIRTRPLTRSPGPARLNKGQAGTFTVTASDVDGDPLTYAWTAAGGTLTGTGNARDISFATSGAKTVSVQVTDGFGGSVTTQTPVTVANRPPTVPAGTPTTLNIGVQGTLTASATDPDGDPLAYAWTVVGGSSGSYTSLSTTGDTFKPTFSDAGSYTVSARVDDGDGGVVTRSFAVTVPNKPPTVDFSWTPKVVQKGDVVTFTSDSVDPDGKPLAKQEWDLDGDGNYNDGFGDTATRTYTTSGSRTIGLRVTDQDGGVSVGHLVLVPGNHPPQAAFTASPASPVVGQAVTFSSTSKDSDGRVASLAWDLNGDNVFNEGTGTTASTTFTAVGTYRVGLKVTDDDGGSDVTFVSVAVKPASGVLGASSISKLKILKPFPKVRFAGRLTSRGARITLLSVRAPKGAKISISCKHGCPHSKLARLARNVRVKSMQGTYRVGATLVITVTKSGAIGKYTKITIKRGKSPKRTDRCLWPKSKKPRSCPTGVGLS